MLYSSSKYQATESYNTAIYLKGRYETLPAKTSLYASSGDSFRYIICFYGKRGENYLKIHRNNLKLLLYCRRHKYDRVQKHCERLSWRAKEYKCATIKSSKTIKNICKPWTYILKQNV